MRTSDKPYHRVILIDEDIRLVSHDYFSPDQLAAAINDPIIAENTLTIPYPYTIEDALMYRDAVSQYERARQHQKDWAVAQGDRLIGGIGLLCAHGPDAHLSEIGYWLRADQRGQGLMTRVIRGLTDYALTDEGGFTRLYAHVFPENIASCKSLERAGYVQEGYLHKYHQKASVFRDVRLYARWRESL